MYSYIEVAYRTKLIHPQCWTDEAASTAEKPRRPKKPREFENLPEDTPDQIQQQFQFLVQLIMKCLVVVNFLKLQTTELANYGYLCDVSNNVHSNNLKLEKIIKLGFLKTEFNPKDLK